MGLIPAKTPLTIKRMFPNYIWDIPNTNKTIYLSFDDGPTPEITNWTLKTLNDFNAKATFFCIGNNIAKYPKIFTDILNEGHAIGNHTYNHQKGWKTPIKNYLKNVFEAQEIMEKEIQDSEFRVQNLFRPPYGQLKSRQGKKLIALGYDIIMWDVLSFDWDKNTTKENCLKHVLNNATNGSIVVFHDSVKASRNMQYALPKTLEYFNNKGYRFETIPSK
ncbi:polysaccharide deacetylase family protein [Snuella sedimenti]|uniref:Polysaccharide deacetylase family protein n=1 Tax=Snuella sedimenti TaxID=2798802 RepID=A0A8J7IXI7_9FLAO|nr:polysaccharide deacetylase family protein [Snuella sedimenti]MBJ6369085.1 polysaccharide deacetylase family protein [Snuella sedimenti]